MIRFTFCFSLLVPQVPLWLLPTDPPFSKEFEISKQRDAIGSNHVKCLSYPQMPEANQSLNRTEKTLKCHQNHEMTGTDLLISLFALWSSHLDQEVIGYSKGVNR